MVTFVNTRLGLLVIWLPKTICLFMQHSGLLHIVLSSWVLLSFGPRVCKGYGSFTFLLIYILGGISGNFSSFLHTAEPTVGGSVSILPSFVASLILRSSSLSIRYLYCFYIVRGRYLLLLELGSSIKSITNTLMKSKFQRPCFRRQLLLLLWAVCWVILGPLTAGELLSFQSAIPDITWRSYSFVSLEAASPFQFLRQEKLSVCIPFSFETHFHSMFTNSGIQSEYKVPEQVAWGIFGLYQSPYLSFKKQPRCCIRFIVSLDHIYCWWPPDKQVQVNHLPY